MFTDWEPSIPFAAFVSQKSTNNLPSGRSNDYDLSQFFQLPFDIKLMVYQACDAPTLFNLMRSCQTMRSEAEKAF
jgi:hypothetical protein